MRVRLQVRHPHPLDQLRERRITRHVRPQHQRVHEETDEIVEGVVGMAGDRRADRDVLPAPSRDRSAASAAWSTMNRLARCSRAVRPRRSWSSGGSSKVIVSPSWRRSRAGPVEGERQFLGKVGQGPLPVSQLASEFPVGAVARSQEFALPEAVVRVLDGQRLPRRRLAGDAGRVRGRQVAGERGAGPGVGGDVMREEEQDVLVVGELEEPDAEGVSRVRSKVWLAAARRASWRPASSTRTTVGPGPRPRCAPVRPGPPGTPSPPRPRRRPCAGSRGGPRGRRRRPGGHRGPGCRSVVAPPGSCRPRWDPRTG